MNSQLKFNYSYSVMGSLNKELLDKADLLIIQISIWGNKNTISDNLSERYGDYSEKLIWHNPLEQFVKNITPIIFIKNQDERSNFKYYSQTHML